MEKMKTTTLTSVLKTLTLVLALTITSQAVHAQHTQGPTVEGVALPNLGGGEEGEITEEQVIEIQRQCNENLVKEYLHNGSGGVIGLVGKMSVSSKVRFPYDRYSNGERMSKSATLEYHAITSTTNKLYFKQSNYDYGQVPDILLNSAYIEIAENTKSKLNVYLRTYDMPAFVINAEIKYIVNGLGQVLNEIVVINKLGIVKTAERNIKFSLIMGGPEVIFSYPTAKYVSCLKAGVASLAK